MGRYYFSLLLGVFLFCSCQSDPFLSNTDTAHDEISEEIERLKAEASSPIGDNIKVVVGMLSVSSSEFGSIEALFRYVNEDIAIAKRPSVFTGSGLRVGLAGDNFRFQLNIAKSMLSSSEDSEIFLALADGATGYISIGQEISVPRFYYMGYWYTSVEYQFRRAGRSLEVTARKLPNGSIEMELTPIFSKFLSNEGDLVLTELSTKVIARPGQTLVIGGSEGQSSDVANALLSYRSLGRQNKTLITVTPYTW
jgi:hypothetical protein